MTLKCGLLHLDWRPQVKKARAKLPLPSASQNADRCWRVYTRRDGRDGRQRATLKFMAPIRRLSAPLCFAPQRRFLQIESLAHPDDRVINAIGPRVGQRAAANFGTFL